MVIGHGLAVVPVPVLRDNYVWLLHDQSTGQTAAVDPSVGEPVLQEAETRGWRLSQVLNTHWHPDHTGGNQFIHEAAGVPVWGPEEARKVYPVDRVLAEGDRITVGRFEAEVWAIPAHTAGHIAFYFESAKAVFVGDTLFAMGCGRLFEGSAEQMYGNLQRIAALPADVRIYCGHEYTLANAHFAAHAEPDNTAIADRLSQVKMLRDQGKVTLPTTVREERATNPFVRVRDAGEFARLRAAKDSFR